MTAIAEKIVKYRSRFLAAALVLCALCALLALKVPINTDMTKYLPDSSPMKQGIDLMAEEFSSLQMPNTIRVMLRVPETGEDTADALLKELAGLDYVSSAVRTDETRKDGQQLVLYTVSTEYDYQSKQELKIESDILSLRKLGYDLEMVNDNIAGMAIPLVVYAAAVVLLMAVLFAMCGSWMEPFLFLAAIGIAIVLNMGTNIVLGSVSQTTYSISAVLQLVLSMDYSVILMNRYRQERQALEARGVIRPGQEKAGRRAALEEAMERSWRKAFPSVASSGFTTFVGLIMLVFMRFKIGKDLGLVLAKGVLLSMICVLTVLPALILLFDEAVQRSAKKVLYIPTGALSRFSYRFRWVLTIGFVLLFGLFRFAQSQAGVSYSLSPADPIAEVFPQNNPIVLIYSNEDEQAACSLADTLQDRDGVTQIFSYGHVLQRQMKPDEMTEYIGQLLDGGFSSYLSMDSEEETTGDRTEEEDAAAGGKTSAGTEAASTEAEADTEAAAGTETDGTEEADGAETASGKGTATATGMETVAGLQVADPESLAAGLNSETLQALYALYALQNGGNESGTLSIEQVFSFVSGNLDNPLLGAFLSSERKEQIQSLEEMPGAVKQMMVGPEHSLMMIMTQLPVESEETEALVRDLRETLDRETEGEYYLVGNSPMNIEMKDSFDAELLLITLLTAAAIFIVVAVTFRQLLIPVLLVALVQCGVYMTITTVWLLGYSMYFLAIVIVQCILMGATVDYAILMTNYYREIRQVSPKREALRETYEKSVHTILTSALFMIIVTGVIGFSPVEPTIGQICQSISLGALSATVLVLFVLPGMLSALDRWTSGRERKDG